MTLYNHVYWPLWLWSWSPPGFPPTPHCPTCCPSRLPAHAAGSPPGPSGASCWHWRMIIFKYDTLYTLMKVIKTEAFFFFKCVINFTIKSDWSHILGHLCFFKVTRVIIGKHCQAVLYLPCLLDKSFSLFIKFFPLKLDNNTQKTTVNHLLWTAKN